LLQLAPPIKSEKRKMIRSFRELDEYLRRMSAAGEDPALFVYNPILSRKKAAEYLGRSGKTLDRLELKRSPMPGTSRTVEMGYRLSTLNAYLASLEDPASRTKKVRTPTQA
jgi:hypothetical protein